jgi:Uma2 family endonuclease
VVEVASPGDDSWRKFDFYAAHGVDEVLIADPQTSTLHWFDLVGDRYQPTHRSDLLGVDVAEVHAAIDWPDT